jgi:hypothetical protein
VDAIGVPDVLETPDVLEVLAQRARDSAVASGRLLCALIDTADAAKPGFDADEIAFVLHWSQSAARSQLSLARYLRDVLPDVFAALCVGELDMHKARVFVDVLANADDSVAVRVAEAVLPAALELTATQLRQRLRRRLLAIDPAGAGERTRRTVADRYVAASPDAHGTASLYGVRLPAARAAAAFERVDAFARTAKTGGDDRTLDQLRADVFLDLLEGVALATAPIHRRGVIEVTVPWATALGQSNEPGDLAGQGPIDADAVRELLTALAGRNDVDWRYTVIGDDGILKSHQQLRRNERTPRPRIGPPAEADPTRRSPGPVLTRWITARDQTCRAPGCTVPARVCDVDHTIDHAAGGLTSHDNLGLLCRHHHRLKHEGGWVLAQPSPGTFEWQSPSGRIYRR